MGLFSDKVPTAKFNQIGDRCSGVIVAFGKQQRSEYLRGGGIGDPMFWSGGRPVAGAAVDPKTGDPNRPVMDDVVTVDTGVEDSYGCTERRLFIKGRDDLEAIQTACKAAGVRDVEEGGRITKTWASGAGGTADPRVYVYEYVPPGRGLSVDRAIQDEAAPAETLQDVTARKDASAAAAAQRLTGTKKARQDDEPPF